MTDTAPHRTAWIRRPTADFDSGAGNTAARLDRRIEGLRVGLRQDSWRSWQHICSLWADWLRRDGAVPVMLFTGERTGDEGRKTRAELEDWSNRIDCAISGLGT